MNRNVPIRIRANNPHLHNFISKSLRGRVKSFMDMVIYITLPTIDSEPIPTILLDLGEKLV